MSKKGITRAIIESTHSLEVERPINPYPYERATKEGTLQRKPSTHPSASSETIETIPTKKQLDTIIFHLKNIRAHRTPQSKSSSAQQIQSNERNVASAQARSSFTYPGAGGQTWPQTFVALNELVIELDIEEANEKKMRKKKLSFKDDQ